MALHISHKRPRSPPLQWTICEGEAEWQAATGRPSFAAARTFARRVPHWQWLAVSGFLVAACLVAGGVAWHTAQRGLAEIQRELDATLDAELWAAAEGRPDFIPSVGAAAAQQLLRYQINREVDALYAAGQPYAAGHGYSATLEIVDLGEAWALVEVTTAASEGQPALRQTRLYRQTELGWVRAAPSAVCWGGTRRLESAYFIFHYYARDEDAVNAAAAKLDALYPRLVHAFFAGPLPAAKQVVEVTPAQMPGRLATQDYAMLVTTHVFRPGQPVEVYTGPAPAGASATVVVASPGAYLAPETVGDADLVAQAVFLALVHDLTAQAQQAYAIPTAWAPLVDGVRLWQVWQADLPLSVWREPVVRWVFGDPPGSGVNAMEPAFGAELCIHHRLWTATPMTLRIPIYCLVRTGSAVMLGWSEFLVAALGQSQPISAYDPRYIEDLLTGAEVVSPTGGKDWVLWPGTAVALSTVVEYVAATYGADTLPALLAALPDHQSWATLVSAVFGVSAAEFEAGWRAYLADVYGVRDAAGKLTLQDGAR